ncbi:MAG: thioredoxin domain-containing protein [Acidobacteriota bacterium]|nr:thioredoxin domain-containing protein [Acidobacteriota bacterium]MDQ2840059.1 thioredoxin domain-containing protein [Acidobacteriota bacterium]
MNNLAGRAIASVYACLLASVMLFAQDWKTADSLPGVDFGHLSTAQKTTVLKILRSQECSCGCNFKLAECRVKDTQCSYSTGMAAAVIDAIAHGKTVDEAQAAALASKWGHVQQQKLLDDPVSIPVKGAPSVGSDSAPITLVEFSDFQCPYCAAAIPEIKSVLQAYPTQVKLIFKQYPLEMHSHADLAAAAAIAAQRQGKFWQMHDAMFSHHDDLNRASILALAQQNGLDMNKFEEDLDSTAVRETVVRDVQDGDHAGVQGTPTLFINGQRYNGAIDLEALKPIFEAELKPLAKTTARN